jgi:hypothetical protein
LGSYMTDRSNRQMEDKRYERERKREKQILEQKQKEREEYTKQVATLTLTELIEFSVVLEDVQTHEFSNEDFDKLLAMIETFKMDYLKIPYDTRLTLFPYKTQYWVQTAYNRFQAFCRTLLPLIEGTRRDSVRFNEAVKELEPDIINESVEEAISALKKLSFDFQT